MIEYENLRTVNAPFMNEFRNELEKVLDRGWYILGEELQSFETEFAKYCDASYCVGVANGMEALTLALMALDFPAGSEIIVPSNTYIASILAIIHAGHIPVLVEPDIHTYNLDPNQVLEAISQKTKAIMPVHLYGRMAPMPELLEIAKRKGLAIVEDAAQAHGASILGKKAGGFGDITCFSFYPTKNLGALGDGGAITTNNKEIAERIMALRNYGSRKRYQNEYIGFNSRLDEIQAVFLRIKLKRLDEINEHKNMLASIYYDELKDTGYILPQRSYGYYSTYHIFNIRHSRRDELKQYLFKNGIQTDIHYPTPPAKQMALKSVLSEKEFPVAEDIHRTTLSLPISFSHTSDDVKTVCMQLRRFEEAGC